MKPENAVPSRMSVQLRRALITIGLVAALLSVLVAAILFHRAFAAQVDQDLARTAQAVAAACQALAETDPDSLDSYLDNTSLRLTLIDPDGNVTANTGTNPIWTTTFPAPKLPTPSRRARAAACAAARQSAVKPITMR